jgi:hypothetical protein
MCSQFFPSTISQRKKKSYISAQGRFHSIIWSIFFCQVNELQLVRKYYKTIRLKMVMVNIYRALLFTTYDGLVYMSHFLPFLRLADYFIHMWLYSHALSSIAEERLLKECLDIS